jgi:hypothetical protein
METNVETKTTPTDLELERESNRSLRKERRSFQVKEEYARMLFASVGTIIFFFAVRLYTHSLVWSFVTLPIPLFLGAIKWGRPVHNYLHYLFGGRTKMGCSERLFLEFWFLVGYTQRISVRELTHTLPTEDTMAKDVKMAYIPTIGFRVKAVAPDGFWKNFFRPLLYLFNPKANENAEGLYNFAGQENMEEAFQMLRAVVRSAVAKHIMKYTSYELRNVNGLDGSVGNPVDREQLENDIMQDINKRAVRYGLEVFSFAFDDLDTHDKMADFLELITKQQILGKATGEFLAALRPELVKTLQEGGSHAEAALKIMMIKALEAAGATDGQVGQIVRAFAAVKFGGAMPTMTEQPEALLVR